MSRRAGALARRVVRIVPVDVVVWDAERDVPQPKARLEVVVRTVSARERAALDVVPPGRRDAVAAFLARGDVGYVAVVDGRFAGWIWLSRVSHRDPWSGLHIRLGPEEAYSYAMWALAEYRTAGVAAVLVARLLADARADPSIRRVYGWVDRDNRESQTLLRLVFGFTQVQEARRVHVLDERLGFKLPWSDRPRGGPLSPR